MGRSCCARFQLISNLYSYRLGAFGYLASKDIQEDNASAGDQGVGNYGIRDSVTAFAWVKKNIKAFGGDPAKVTGAGHSAGSSKKPSFTLTIGNHCSCLFTHKHS